MRNYSLDTLKLICAILVIFIHTPQPEIWKDCITPIIRCAVPIFFMISGYLTYGKNDLNSVIRKRILGQLKIFCWAFVLYLIISSMINGVDTFRTLHHQLAAPGFLLFNAVPCAFHLWYILAYIYVLIIMLFVEKLNLYKPLFYITPILLMFAIIVGTYSEIFLNRVFPIFLSRNFLFTGLPFFSLGMMVKRMKKIPAKWVVMCSCIFFYITGIFETLHLRCISGDLYVSNIFLSVSIFMLFINIKQTKSTPISKIGSEDCLYIFVLHYFFALYFERLQCDMPFLSYISAPLVLCLTLLLIAFLRKVKVIGKII